MMTNLAVNRVFQFRLYTVLLILVSCSMAFFKALGQNNLLINSGFESFATGHNGYLTNGSGSSTGKPGQWQLSFVGNNYPTCTGASCGTSQIIDISSSSGNKALAMIILKHTNRNDIKLLQSIGGTVPAGMYVLSFWMRSTQVGIPVTANILKSTESITSNGVLATQFATTTSWQRYKVYVDLSSWSTAERTNMRISIRPNTVTSTATPQGPYPKTFLFDDLSFAQLDPLNEMKEIALQIAQDRQSAALDSGFVQEASTLTAEITALKSASFSLPVPLSQSLGFFPEIKVTTNNIFIDAIHSWAASYRAQAFNYTYPKATANFVIYPGGAYDHPRVIGRVLEQLYWLILSPHSRYQYDPELFRRYLLLIYATADDYAIHSFNSEINDWFAVSSISNSWCLVDTCFRQFLPQTIRTQIRQSARNAGSQHYNWSQAFFDYHYTNRDVSYAEVLMNTGLHLDRIRWVNMAKLIIDSIYHADLYPDGAFSYYKKQNEVATYHGGNVMSLIKLWVASGYQPAFDCVREAANYELLSIEHNDLPEYYTSTAWKTQWNGVAGYSPEALIYIAQNPWLKTKYDAFHAVNSISDSPLNIPFYDSTLDGLPLPDNYIVYDRNIHSNSRFKNQ